MYSLATLHVVGGSGAESDKPQSGFCTYFLLRDNMAPVELLARLRVELAAVQFSGALQLEISVLRGIHYIEAERAIGPKSVQPVLDPYDWMAPQNTAKVGEVTVFDSTARGARERVAQPDGVVAPRVAGPARLTSEQGGE